MPMRLPFWTTTDPRWVGQLSKQRLSYWGRKKHYPFLPLCWADIVAGWLSGCTFSIERPGQCMPSLPLALTVNDISESFPAPWAFTSPAFGRQWLFSHQAVYAALEAFRAWGIGEVVGGPFWIRWMGILTPRNPQNNRVFVFRSSPLPGFWAYQNEEQILLWHPYVLGPVGLWEKGGITPSLGLAIRQDDQKHRYWRGEAVTDGIWASDGFHPVVARDGWVWDQYMKDKGDLGL